MVAVRLGYSVGLECSVLKRYFILKATRLFYWLNGWNEFRAISRIKRGHTIGNELGMIDKAKWNRRRLEVCLKAWSR